MSKIALIALPLLLVVGVGAALLLDSGETDPTTPLVLPDQGSAALVEEDAGTMAGETVSGPTIETAEFIPDEEELEDAAAPEDRTSTVYVIGPDGQPIPGAEVRLLRRSADEETEDRGRFGRWLSAERPPHVYREIRTDDEGLAILSPLPRRRFVIEARTERMYGRTEFEQGRLPGDEAQAVEAVALIRMAAIKRVRVQVLDSGGAPVGDIKVEARAQGASNNFWARGGRGRGGRGGGNQSGLGTWTDNPSGQAVLEITQEDRELHRAETIAVTAILPGLDPVSIEAPLSAERDNEVTLRIPRTTAIDVELRDHKGEVHRPGISLQWVIDPTSIATEEDRNNRMRSFFGRSINGSRWIAGGRTRIGGIAPGAKVTFTTRPRGRVPEQTEVQLNATEVEHQAIVKVGGPQPWMVMAIADEREEKASRVTFRVEVAYDDDVPEVEPEEGTERFMRMMQRGMVQGNTNLRTNEEGILRVAARAGSSGEIRLFSSGNRGWTRGGPGGGNQDDARPLKTIRFEALEGGEERDLGLVALDPGATLLTGRVVTDEGSGISGARVTLQGRPRQDASSNSNDPRERWRRFRTSRFTATTDQDGSFRLLGQSDPSYEWTVEATGGEYRGDPLEVTLGQEEVLITLQRTGGLEGSVVLDDIIRRRDVQLRLTKDGSDANDRANRRDVRINGEGAFTINRLTPGYWTLTARIAGSEAGVIQAIEIPAGETSRDQRAQEWLLGRDFFRATVTVLGMDGEPMNRARVNFAVEGAEANAFEGRGRRGGPPGRGGRGGRGGQERTNREGVASRLMRRGDRVTVSVSADGFAASTIENAQFPLEVRMEKGARVVVRFDPPMPGFEDVNDFRLRLTTAEAEARGGAFGGGPGMRGGGGRVRTGDVETSVNNIAAGAYTLRLFYRGPRPPEGGRGGSFGNLSLGEITVPRGQQVVEATVTVTAQMLEAGLQTR